jgi:predicted transcriptional regulator
MLLEYRRGREGADKMAAISKRRDRHDIIAEILKTARGGKIKTHIMYKAKLSYSQINEYLNLLITKGFLENTTIKRKRQTITMYKTTRKGIEFLDHLEFINRLWTYQ